MNYLRSALHPGWHPVSSLHSSFLYHWVSLLKLNCDSLTQESKCETTKSPNETRACMLSRFSHVWLLEMLLTCSPPGSSVRRVLQARMLEWVDIPPPGDLSSPGMESVSLKSPALAGRFCFVLLFTATAIWEAPWWAKDQLKRQQSFIKHWYWRP